jgi:hydrogenase-1 operon protein HyaF
VTRLQDIPVRVAEPQRPASTSAAWRALLHEIEAGLTALAHHDRATAIDLRRMPLTGGDVAALRDTLGSGEVSAKVDALGPTRIHETRFAGVWWVTHCNADGTIVGELIEIARCPSLLPADDQDLTDGLSRLRAELATDLESLQQEVPR